MSELASKNHVGVTYVYHANEMPVDAPAVIFCPNDRGLNVYEYCHNHGIKVIAFIDQECHGDFGGEVPVLMFEKLGTVEPQQVNLLISVREYEKYLPLILAAGFRGLYFVHPFATTLTARQATTHQLAQGQICDDIVKTAPRFQHAVDIFKGDWMTKLPVPGVVSGWNKLFDDGRLSWAHKVFGGFEGQNILELGPYEGAHTYTLDRVYHAASVLSIEANPRAFLRCLIVKNEFDMKNSKFLLGDFVNHLQVTGDQYDLIFASGVLYHMADPFALLRLIAGHARRVFLWTHVYDHDLVQANTNLNFRFEPNRHRDVNSLGISWREYCFIYRDGTQTTNHLGGTEQFAYWLRLEDIVAILGKLGFDRVVAGPLDNTNTFGPNICIAAEKTGA